MPSSPGKEVPRHRCISTVSALSLALWAVRILSSSPGARLWKKPYRTWRPHSSKPRPRRRAKAATSSRRRAKSSPKRLAKARAAASSRSDSSPRSWWFTWASTRRSGPRRPSSQWARAVESAPPEKPTTTLPLWGRPEMSAPAKSSLMADDLPGGVAHVLALPVDRDGLCLAVAVLGHDDFRGVLVHILGDLAALAGGVVGLPVE